MPRYLVTLQMIGEITVELQAASFEDAKTAAERMVDIDSATIDDAYTVVERIEDDGSLTPEE